MATDYDQLRDLESIEAEQAESLAALRSRAARKTALLELGDADLPEDLELPGADLSQESLVVTIVPRRKDEFRCERCFLLVHQAQRARPDTDICRDCW